MRKRSPYVSLVPDVSQITDPELLRQIVTLQQQEIHRLHQRLAQLCTQLAALQGKQGSKQLELELVRLQEQLAAANRRMFGPSSEKRPGPQAPEAPEAPPPKGHGPTEQPQLPRLAQRHELAPCDRRCPFCQLEMAEMKGQTEDSEEVTVVERKFLLVTNQRQKYRCSCNAAILTAPGPQKLIPGGRYSLEFAVEVAIQKYSFHMPLERQARRMLSEGLRVTRQTLWDQLYPLATLLTPSYQQLRSTVLEPFVVHMDETPWKLLTSRPSKTWQVWCISSETGTYYHLDPHRSAAVAQEILGDFAGVLVTDGLPVYQTVARGSPQLVLAFCWAHVRRKLLEAEAAYPQCAEALDLIGALYQVERGAPSVRGLSPAEAVQALQLRAQLRATQSQPILERLWAWTQEQVCLPRSSLRGALDYMRSLWPGLTRFVSDPRIPLDNNTAEREMRTVVLGRKNHYGSKSQRGTQVAAVLYSLIETARQLGVDERQYLLSAARFAMANPGEALLPHALRS